ncbi:hypothetical protein GLAREA_00632 [Glarea lozoyensis ATCC 20868]|uniref:Uncharacterized protein n=1 Tax=Glarea lozoyensis (strain ATCC 20868 / MF5171) TaxID=1116229 RepID=S3CSR2_GLAL2|nr:uncharacterized protein GLAREA_00632 [Glarea lozoyensis ATCC 20868]EPE29472.1 hypothetical protein GLAREA_00632 [Glarea lozoyensis ATCC 20868]
MAQYGGGDGLPPWGYPSNYGNDHTPHGLNHKISSVSAVSAMSDRPALNHKFSSISAISTMSSTDTLSRQASVVSLPSPDFGHSHPNSEQSDISHVQLSDVEGSGIPRPSSTSSISRGVSTLPDLLRVGSPASSSPKGFPTFRSSNSSPSYSPVASADTSRRSSLVGRTPSKKYTAIRRGSLLSGRHGSIPETEEIDMGLLQNAVPMSFVPHKTRYSTVAEDETDDVGGVSVDLTSLTGPMNPKNEAEWKAINQKEKDGQLTGGLGAGWTPDETLTSTDLLAKAPPTPTTPSLVRRFTLGSARIGRAPTLRNLAQIEANKSGKVIEVILETEPKEDDENYVGMDLSSMEGSSTTRSATFDTVTGSGWARRRTTLPTKTEVYHPQANWKPFSMRWPYLSALIAISVGLAAVQEFLYQRSATTPLYTFKDAKSLSTWDYFCFKYMPTMIAVTFGILWQITDFEVKRLEAFYQLSKEDGALAAESLNVDYITFFNFLRPIRALRYKHYAVAVSSVATLIAVSAIPTLQSASVILKPDRKTRKENPHGDKTIHIDAVWSRFLSALLMVIAIFGSILLWQLEKRRSGLVADVKGIAGIAAMANKSHILNDFKDMDTATPDAIHDRLKKHRYTLRNSSLAPDSDNVLTREEADKYDQKKKTDSNPHPFMLRLFAGIPFIIGMMLFMVVMPIFLFQSEVNKVTEKAPWLLTVIAVAIKLAWGTLETDVRMMEPFYILSKRHASPKVLTLDYTAMAFGYMPIRALLNGHFLVFLVGLGSVLAEILTICASSFGNVSGTDFAKPKPDKRSLLASLLSRDGEDDDDNKGLGGNINGGEETFLSFWISFGLALAILSFLCLVATCVYMRRRQPFLPRQPNTISSVLAYIHQSKMLYDFVDTEKMNNDEMVKRLGKIGKTYGLGWFAGRDGDMHCGVDQEELSSNYKHGENVKLTNQPWNSHWEDY